MEAQRGADWAAVRKRIRHDLVAIARHVDELSGWISEDLVESGIEAPSVVTEALAMLRGTGAVQSRLAESLDQFLQACAVSRGSADLGDALRLLPRTLLHSDRVTLSVEGAIDLVPMPETDLVLMLRLVLDNAIQHSGRTPCAVLIRYAKGAEAVTLHIEDDGVGVPQDMADAVFGFGMRLRPAHPASGTGLTTVRQLARSHGGEARLVAPMKLGGVAVEVTLPLAQAQAQA